MNIFENKNQNQKYPADFSEKEQQILHSVRKLFSRSGSHGMSMRLLAKELQLAPSVLYHYFQNQDDLMYQMYRFTNYEVGLRRAALPKQRTVRQQFAQLIQFQFDNAESVVAVLKFYLVFRDSFAQSEHKTLPKEAAKHVTEVLQFGIEQGVYRPDCLDDAKIIAHSINGYLLEHFPYDIEQQKLQKLIDHLVRFFEQPLLITKVGTDSTK